MSEKCPTPGPVMFGYNKLTKKGRVWRPSCKRWSCPICREANAAEWGFMALYGSVKLQDDGLRLFFITMTSHEKLSPEKTLEVWPHAWKNLHQRLKYKYGKGQYFMVSERHKDFRLHMHAICTWEVTERWLKDNSRACGLGYMQDAKPVNDTGLAASYVAKYLSKFGDVWPTRWRRVRTSREWPKLQEPKPKVEWVDFMLQHATQEAVNSMIYNYGTAGYDVNVAKGLLESLPPGN